MTHPIEANSLVKPHNTQDFSSKIVIMKLCLNVLLVFAIETYYLLRHCVWMCVCYPVFDGMISLYYISEQYCQNNMKDRANDGQRDESTK